MNWQWLNEPSQWDAKPDGLRLRTDAHVDFWRETLIGEVRDSAHFYFTEVTGDFTIALRLAGNYQEQYDQAGIVVRRDAENYLKCGVEFIKGMWEGRYPYRGDARLIYSALTTNGRSEWSTLPQLPTEPDAVWLRIERESDAFFVSHSVDGEDFTVMKLFSIPNAETIAVGPYAGSPEGAGYDVEFSHLRVSARGEDAVGRASSGGASA